ncbi:MAG: RNA 2'-phosphotransferase [bacterium]
METGLSKTLSYFLRHNPNDGNLTVDDQGFVDLDDLLETLRQEGWDLSREELIERIDDPDVERFERVESVVRATYGHSIDVEPEYREIEPEFPLFHGTARRAWSSIKQEGIKPMNRQYVHLSRSREEALRVGRRHDNNPVILEINPSPGVTATFYEAGPVILTEHVPPDWINKHETT